MATKVNRKYKMVKRQWCHVTLQEQQKLLLIWGVRGALRNPILSDYYEQKHVPHIDNPNISCMGEMGGQNVNMCSLAFTTVLTERSGDVAFVRV